MATVTVPTVFITTIFDIPTIIFDFLLAIPKILLTFAAVRG